MGIIKSNAFAGLSRIWKCGQAPVCPDITNTAQSYCDTDKASVVNFDTESVGAACGTAVPVMRPALNTSHLQLYSNIRKTNPRGFKLYTGMSAYRHYL